ncbi:hypothetical protein, partial [Listeria booriae]|uniref:hypothetical protein n=1 Tax=Listeria booriae TaxID=1552123 RepID=UPI001C8AD88E
IRAKRKCNPSAVLMTQNNVWTFWKNTPLLKLVWCQNFFGLVTCSRVGGLSVSGNHVFKVFNVYGLSFLSRDPASTASPSELSQPPQKSREDFYCACSKLFQG